MASKRNRRTALRFVAVYHWELDLPAYRELSVYGRSLLIEFRRFYNGHNNGEIVMSVRQAARLLGCNKNTAEKTLQELVKKGWIRPMVKGSFSQKTDKTATTWRITNEPIGLGVDTPETKEYASWRPREMQNAVPREGTVCPTTRDHEPKTGPTRRDRTPPNCPTTRDRDTPKTRPDGPTRRDTSNLAIPGGATSTDTSDGSEAVAPSKPDDDGDDDSIPPFLDRRGYVEGEALVCQDVATDLKGI